MQNDVLLVQTDGRVCTITLNRPEKRNSLSPELLKKLTATLGQLAASDEVRVLVIRGAENKAFCAGFDLNLLPTGDNDDGEGINPFEEAMEAIVRFPYPVIAMMNGYAFGGGCDLAVSCDIRIGVEEIKIGMVPAKLGVVYSASGLRRFIRVIGLSKTKELFFTGRHYKGPCLKEIGFLNYLVSQEDLETFTYEMAREIAENAPLSLKGTKRVLELITQASAMSSEAWAEADEIATASFLSEDLKEGQAAFFEKRKPEFKGR